VLIFENAKFRAGLAVGQVPDRRENFFAAATSVVGLQMDTLIPDMLSFILSRLPLELCIQTPDSVPIA